MTDLYATIADLTPGEHLRVHTSDFSVDVWVEDSHHYEYRAEAVVDVILQTDDWDSTGLYLTARSTPSRPVLHRLPLVRQLDDVDPTGGIDGETAHIVCAVDRLTPTTSLARKSGT